MAVNRSVERTFVGGDRSNRHVRDEIVERSTAWADWADWAALDTDAMD